MGKVRDYVKRVLYGKSEKYEAVDMFDTIPISRTFLEQVSRIHCDLIPSRKNRECER